VRNLEKRLEKLEEVYSPAEITVIMLTHFGQGEIKGWKGEGIYIARDPGESEEASANRAAAEARAYYNQHPSLVSGHIALQMDRECVSGVKLEPRPQSTPTTGTPTTGTPKAEPEHREITVIRDWMT